MISNLMKVINKSKVRTANTLKYLINEEHKDHSENHKIIKCEYYDELADDFNERWNKNQKNRNGKVRGKKPKNLAKEYIFSPYIDLNFNEKQMVELAETLKTQIIKIINDAPIYAIHLKDGKPHIHFLLNFFDADGNRNPIIRDRKTISEIRNIYNQIIKSMMEKYDIKSKYTKLKNIRDETEESKKQLLEIQNEKNNIIEELKKQVAEHQTLTEEEKKNINYLLNMINVRKKQANNSSDIKLTLDEPIQKALMTFRNQLNNNNTDRAQKTLERFTRKI